MLGAAILKKVSLLLIVAFLPLGCLAKEAPLQPATQGKEVSPAAAKAKPAPSATIKPAAEEPRYGGILPVALYQEPASLDLQQHHYLATRMAAAPAYDTLLEYNPLKQDEIIPDLAERYEVSKDALTYTFHLVKGVKFHDGSPLTAEDVKYNFDRLRNPPKGIISPKKGLLASIDRIETPDDNTVRIVASYPDASFLSGIALSHHAIYPRKVVEEKGDMKKTAVGTGPFKFVRWDTGLVVEHVKNSEYFRKGRPYLDRLTFYIITDPATGFAAFRTGRVMMTSQGSGGLNPLQAEITERELKGKARPLPYVSISNSLILINVSRRPLDDVRVRKALHLLADRPTIIKVAWGGDGMLSAFFVPEPFGKWEFPNEELLKLPGYRQDKKADIEEAKKVLAEAGYANGLPLSILTRSIQRQVRTAEMLREQYKAAGIDLKLEIEETGVWTDRKNKGNYELLVDPWGVHVDDPTAWLENILAPNIPFKDEQLNAWKKEQARILDFEERRKLVRKIELRLLDVLPVVPSVRGGKDTMGIWDSVKNYTTPIGLWSSHKYTEVWLAK